MKAAIEVAKMGHHAVLVIKTGHSRYPKKYLEEKMDGFPGGTWVVLRGKCKRSGVELVAIGYRYNSKKVLHFVITVGAGRTSKGAAYQMKFNDAHGNVCHHAVAPLLFFCGTSNILTPLTSIIICGNSVLLWRNAG